MFKSLSNFLGSPGVAPEEQHIYSLEQPTTARSVKSAMLHECTLRSYRSARDVMYPKAINMLLLLRNSLRDLCVLCVSAVVECARPIFTAETQRTQRSRRESLRFIKLSACAKAALLRSEDKDQRSKNKGQRPTI